MSSVAQHYEELLAEHYLWMSGVTFEEKVFEQKGILNPALTLLPATLRHGPAVDLGCGPGFQAVALAELGFSPVLAVDSSGKLLKVLEAHRAEYPIQTRHADLTSLDSVQFPENVSLIICMGDTLTHLPSKDTVHKVFADAYKRLSVGGLFILTFRDLTGELKGSDRFLPVRADDHKIMTCFLEYKSDESVVVHDLIHIKEQDGWALHKSSYEKLRLSSTWIASALRATGFVIHCEEPSGRLLLLIAGKSD